MSGAPQASAEVTRPLLALVTDRLGLVPRDDWATICERAVPELCARHECSAQEFLERTRNSEHLIYELASFLTIGETHFMRHVEHFGVITEYVSDRVRRGVTLKVNGDADLAIWSAGCSSGEEPYTVAMVLAEALGRQVLNHVAIFATDANLQSIGKGLHAYYGPWSFRGVPKGFVEAHFDADAKGKRHRVKDMYRGRVRLEPGNVWVKASTLPSASVDIIFFRNVAIYLRSDFLARLYAEFARALKPGGLLLLGPADPRPRVAELSNAGDDTGTVHRKVTGLSTMKAASTPSVPTRAVSDAERSSKHFPSLAPRSALRRRWGSGRRAPLRPAALTSAPAHKALPPRTVPPAASPAMTGHAGPRTSTVRAPGADEVGATLASQISRCMQLGNAGHTDAALETASQLVNKQGGAPVLVARAQLFLEAGEVPRAVTDLRAALFLEPGHRLGRFWYAAALTLAAQNVQAGRQLEILMAKLTEAALNDTVEDGETTVEHLMLAARFLREGQR